MLVGIGTKSPENRDDAEDHNRGVDICVNLRNYLRRRKASAFFKRLLEHPRIGALLSETEEVKKRRLDQHRTGEREAFDWMIRMQTLEFARLEAGKAGNRDAHEIMRFVSFRPEANAESD